MKDQNLFDLRRKLFPLRTEIRAGQLTIAGQPLQMLARQYGTPLYVYDQATLDNALAQYRTALHQHYPGESGLTYAGKAFLPVAAAQWGLRHGLMIDCTGETEIAIARIAGAGRENLLVHGVGKSRGDLLASFAHSGVIVVDNAAELDRIIAHAEANPKAKLPQIWLRLRPGVAVETHHRYTQTGQEDSKFGMGPEEFLQALSSGLDHGLEITGLHFHQGSHFHDPSPLGPALDMALDLSAELRTALGWTPQVISPGGGWGVPYHEDDLPHPVIDEYVKFTAEWLVRGCLERGLPIPRLQLEPGRSLVAQAAVALYRVEAVKQSSMRCWLLLDGGMADNPRPALYRARYTALPVEHPERPAQGVVWMGGPFCESGDVLIEGLPMPLLQAGDLIAVPVSGAYQVSMSSNYNGARRPPVLWLDESGVPRLIRRRETIEDLIGRDIPLPPAEIEP